MKTFDQIIERLNHDEDDFFGHTAEVCMPYLPFEQVTPYLKDGVTSEQWTPKPYTREAVIEDMKDYMEFAWGKVEDHRGLSASRSVEKMQAWLWLLEDVETLEYAQDHYTNYGAPVLKKICDVYNFPIPDGDDIANMAQGKPCTPHCDMGCRN